MRILHTSDWHLMDTLGARRLSRRDDINRSLHQIAKYLDEGAVDVMIVAGDLFRELGMKPQEVREALVDMKTIFTPFLKRGGSIITTLGNHDNTVYFEIVKTAFDLVIPMQSNDGAISDLTGRIYFAPRAQVLTLKDKNNKNFQFVLMPYPTSIYLPKNETGRSFKSPEERNRAIQGQFREVLNHLKQEKLDPTIPSVLVSHIHVRGTELHGRFRLSDSENVMFDQTDIPTSWCYAAFGHIHQAQEPLKGASHVKYSGSIERLDYGERGDEKSVVLFEIGGDNQLVKEPELLTLETSKFLSIEITDPENEIQHLRDKYPNAEDALVKYKLHWDPHKHNKTDFCREIERIFPRWYSCETVPIGGLESITSLSLSSEKMRDVPSVVREYLTTQLNEHKHKDELLQLADELIAEEFSSSEEVIAQ